MNFKWQGGQLLDSVVSLSVPCVLCARLMRLSFSFLVAICKREPNTKHFRMGHKKATHPPWGMLSFLYRGGFGGRRPDDFLVFGASFDLWHGAFAAARGYLSLHLSGFSIRFFSSCYCLSVGKLKWHK